MKMRVTHLTFDMRIGGTEQVIKNLIEGSDTNTFDMSIFCLEQPVGPFGEMLLAQGIRIDTIQRKKGFDTSLIKAIKKHLSKNNIDVLHCHQYTPWVYGTFAAIGTKTKVIFTEHGRFYPDRSSWKRRYVNPVLSFFTDNITAISHATKQALVDYEFIPEQKIEVIYNGITPVSADPARTLKLKQELSINSSTKVIGTIARLDPIKNHHMMFNAYKRVLDNFPDTVLLLIGDGEERENIESLVKKLGIQNKVILTGYISEPGAYLECMDIFLLPSLSEGTSMTLLEAMSLKKPCIVTDAGGNSEIIKNDYNGIVTENDNCEEFSNAISALLGDPSRQKEMGEAAQTRFSQYFAVTHMVDKYRKIYTSLVK